MTAPDDSASSFTDAGPLSRGERAALDGVLSRSRPSLAIEIGPAATGALLAGHCAEVHCLGPGGPTGPGEPGGPGGPGGPDGTGGPGGPGGRDGTGGPDGPGAPILHNGDAQELLPAVLDEIGRNIDFVLVHGDCSPAGPRPIVEALLDSPHVGSAVILVHQATNQRVRRELDAIHYPAWPKVALVDPDFVPGRMLALEPHRHELTGGLALVVLDAARLRYAAHPTVEQRYFSTTALLAEVRDYLLARERTDGPQAAYGGTPIDPRQVRAIGELREELAHAEHEITRLRSVARHHEELWRSLMDSWSWRVTGPIRTAKERARGGGGGGRG